MENKSKCCKSDAILKSDSDSLPDYYRCGNCLQVCDLQKNTGLTLSEFFDDDDALVIKFKMSGKIFTKGFAAYEVEPQDLRDSDGVVTKRKSDEAVKDITFFKMMEGNTNSASTTEMIKAQMNSILQLQQENEEQEKLARLWMDRYYELKNKIRELL